MRWKYLLLRLAIIGIPIIALTSYQVFSSCASDFIIGLCGLSKILLAAIGIGFNVVFLIINLATLRPWNKNPIPKLSVKKNFIQFLIIFLISIPLTGLLLVAGISLWSEKERAQYKIFTAQTIDNFNLINFSEKPMMDPSSGKYEGVETNFSLIASEAGVYSGVVEMENYFGNYMVDRFDGINFLSNTPVKLKFSLFPNKKFYQIKPNGPYYLLVTVWSDDIKRIKEFRLYISGNKNYVNGAGYPVKYIEDLHTRPYLFSDFKSEDQKL